MTEFRDPTSAVINDDVILLFDAALKAEFETALDSVAARVRMHVDDDSTLVGLAFMHEDGQPRFTNYFPHRSAAETGAPCWVWPEELIADRQAAEFAAWAAVDPDAAAAIEAEPGAALVVPPEIQRTAIEAEG